MGARLFCQGCRAIMLAAAETGEPYDPDGLCATCRDILSGISSDKGSYDWLRELPQLKQWLKERGVKVDR